MIIFGQVKLNMLNGVGRRTCITNEIGHIWEGFFKHNFLTGFGREMNSENYYAIGFFF